MTSWSRTNRWRSRRFAVESLAGRIAGRRTAGRRGAGRRGAGRRGAARGRSRTGGGTRVSAQTGHRPTGRRPTQDHRVGRRGTQLGASDRHPRLVVPGPPGSRRPNVPVGGRGARPGRAERHRFRALVAERAASSSDDIGAVSAAARGYLLRSPDEQELLDAATDAARDSDARARVAELERTVRKLTSHTERLTSELVSARRQGAPDAQERADTERLRQRLRDQGTRLRDLHQEVDAGATLAAERIAALSAELDRSRPRPRPGGNVPKRRSRARTPPRNRSAGCAGPAPTVGPPRTGGSNCCSARSKARRPVCAGNGTCSAAATDPADVVAARLSQVLPGAERTADPSRLTAWLGLPGAHLIVDGYNVTKDGVSRSLAGRAAGPADPGSGGARRTDVGRGHRRLRRRSSDHRTAAGPGHQGALLAARGDRRRRDP